MNPDDERSLRVVIQALERLRVFASDQGRQVLASLIEIAQAEAADELRTELAERKRLVDFKAGAYTSSLEAELQNELVQLKRA
jgi:hypothetical protein